MAVTVRLGFVPSYRFRWTPWAERMRRESLAALAALPGVDVIAPEVLPEGQEGGATAAGLATRATDGRTPHGAVRDLDQAEAVAAHFARQGVEGLVLCPVDFGDERSAAKVAERLRMPVFLYATKEPPAAEDASLARVSDSYCGNLAISAALHRRGLPFHFGGLFFPDEAELQTELAHFARAVAVVKGLRNARIGQVGVRPPPFESVSYDEGAMARKFDQNVLFADLADLVDEAGRRADDDPEVRKVVADIRRSAATITVADDYLLTAAKLELALVGFFTRSRLSALAMQCWPTVQRLAGISLCAVFGRLTGRHLLTACEADVLGAVSMLAQYHAALGETLPHLVDWTIQHRDDPNLLLAWHCGNAPCSLARDPQEVALRSRRDMTGERPISPGDPMAGLMQFQLRPGPVTLCRIAECDGEWKLLIARGEVVPSEETLAGTWSWVRVPDHARLYRTLVEEGFIHHASMIHGDQTAALVQACRFLDVRPVVVG